jgi:hypothetical protein
MGVLNIVFLLFMMANQSFHVLQRLRFNLLQQGLF